MNESTLRLALVGCGGIAKAHWRGIKYHAPRIEVTAVVDSDERAAAAMAERTGAAAFTSLGQALAKGEFDAVDLMLPHDLHESATLDSLAAGKHVVLEKPLAHNLASAERILAAGEAAETVFMVAEQAQYWPDIVKSAELIASGAIGDVVAADAFFYDVQAEDPSLPPPWRFSLARSGGGISMDGGAHWIRPLRMMLGEIDEVIAATARGIEAMEGESIAHALFSFKSGVVANFRAIKTDVTMGPIDDFRITGTAGEIVIERGREGRARLFDATHPGGVTVANTFPGRADSYGFELHDFALAVLDGRPLAAPPGFALGELRTALAMYRSVQSRTWEKVWE